MSLDDLQAQLRDALDQQFAALRRHHEGAVLEARQQAEAEAARVAEERTAQLRAELEAQAEQRAAAARAETEQRLGEAAAAERQALEQQLRQAFEHHLAEAVSAAQAEGERQRKQLDLDFQTQLEHVVNSTRRSAELRREAEQRRAQGELEAERERAAAELATLRQQAEADLQTVRQQASQELDAVRGELTASHDSERQRSATELDRLKAALAEAEAQGKAAVETARREFAAELERATTELDSLRQAHADVEDARHEAAAERTRIQADLERTAGELERANTALAEAREQASAALQQARDQANADLEQAREQARRDAEAQAQQAAAADRDRTAMELDRVRLQAQADVDAGRQQAAIEVQRVRNELEAQLQRLRDDAEAERAASHALLAARPSEVSPAAAADITPLVFAIRDLDDCRTLSETLDTLVANAGSLAGRSALFVIDGNRLKFWKAAGIPEAEAAGVDSSIGGNDLLARAIQAGEALRSAAELAPAFARAQGEALATPVMIGGRAVAVLYSDAGSDAGDRTASAFDMIETLTRHASSVVALRTAMRTLDVLRGVPASGNGDAPGDDQGARRFARLLLSEIKLYNEGAVRIGRQQRDLLRRLGTEIDRARRLYEERVPSSIGSRHAYFQQELVQTLADGDPALLGTP